MSPGSFWGPPRDWVCINCSGSSNQLSLLSRCTRAQDKLELTSLGPSEAKETHQLEAIRGCRAIRIHGLGVGVEVEGATTLNPG